MSYLLKVIKTSRPLFWFTHFTLLIYGGLQTSSFHLNSVPFFVEILIFSLPFSLFVFAINDYYDEKTDQLNLRKASIFGEKHDKRVLKNLIKWGISGLLVSLFLVSFLGLAPLFILIILSFLLYFYSAKPIRFKSIPIMDAITGGGLYFYLTALFGYLIFAQNRENLNLINTPLLLFAFLGIVGQLMGTVLDQEPDQKDNIETSAVFFGINKVISFCLMILLVCLYLVRTNFIILSFLTLFSEP